MLQCSSRWCSILVVWVDMLEHTQNMGGWQSEFWVDSWFWLKWGGLHLCHELQLLGKVVAIISVFQNWWSYEYWAASCNLLNLIRSLLFAFTLNVLAFLLASWLEDHSFGLYNIVQLILFVLELNDVLFCKLVLFLVNFLFSALLFTKPSCESHYFAGCWHLTA